MEITKGENANLAGMEPRCPKCGGTELTFKSGSDLVGWMGKIWCASCTGEWAYYDIEDWKDFAQFFRSPAPTPPLDIEAVAEKFFKILTVEVCCECGEPRFPQKQKAGDETKDGWPACVNEECFAYGEQGPISAYRCPISEQQREEILSLLRRHIASPAQPEKRDEWVSVDEPPKEKQWVIVGRNGWPRSFLGRIENGEWIGSYHGNEELPCSDPTHWQPLPAPPQSGKEGQ